MSSKEISSAGDNPETRLESVEEIRRALGQAGQAAVSQARPAAAQPGQDASLADTLPYRPLRRPPVALLCAFDDAGDEGEWFRIRGDKFVIGRSEGDLVIPHETLMSGRHAEISRVVAPGSCRWFLSDLGSKNGTFVRAGKSVLNHGQEIAIGGRRYRFQAGSQAAASAQPAPEVPKETAGWQSVAPQDLLPSLVEITPQGDGQRFLLTAADNWLGRVASQCTIVLGNDPMLSPRHARLSRDARGRWTLENANSRNGVWVRIQKIPLDVSAYFQLGEQRFLIKIPSAT